METGLGNAVETGWQRAMFYRTKAPVAPLSFGSAHQNILNFIIRFRERVSIWQRSHTTATYSFTFPSL